MKGNIIICGAPRAGSTALYRYLSAHPEVSGSNLKELNYFLGGENSYQDCFEEANIDKYLALFGHVNKGQHTLEASPSYLHRWCADRVASRVSSLLPHAKVIFILRNPILRLRSQYIADITRNNKIDKNISFEAYVQACLMGDEDGVFKSIPEDQRKLYLEGLSIGKYYETISKYMQHIGKSQVYIMFSEKLMKNSKQEMVALARFLEVDESFYLEFKYELENKSITPKNKFIYQFSLVINSYMEPIFNKVPQLRSFLRKVHDGLNHGKTQGDFGLSDAMNDKMHEYYHDSHSKLRALVKTVHSSDEMPSWLMQRGKDSSVE